jgi:three-Cys-motif partner protein
MPRDSAPQKWEYKEHTRVKHELLSKYLSPWLMILGRYHRKLVFFDGFAGRGEYIDKKTGNVTALGSPIIALQVANSLLEKCEQKKQEPYFDKFICIGIEENKDNFENLQKVVNREKGKLRFKNKLQAILINGEFATVIGAILKKVGAEIAPSFFFVDLLA